MLYRHTVLIFVSMLTITVLCWANQNIENRIGPFSFDARLMKESRLISQFGEGYIQIEKDGDVKKHIYYVPEQKVWVAIGISHVLDENLEGLVESVLVSKEKLCDEQFKPKKSFGSLITSKGIQIGDAIEKVIAMYGKPSKEYVNVIGQVLRYETDDPYSLLMIEFYFDEKSLHSILISVSE